MKIGYTRVSTLEQNLVLLILLQESLDYIIESFPENSPHIIRIQEKLRSLDSQLI